jgi:hypothetical protein
MFERRYTERQRSLISELKLSGKTGDEIASLCAQGVGDESPFAVPVGTANRIAREEARDHRFLPSELAQRDPAAAVDRLVVNLIGLVETYIAELDPKTRNATTLPRLLRMVEKLHSATRTMPARNGSNGNGHREAEPSFLEKLAEVA